jgi:hypothetical protein
MNDLKLRPIADLLGMDFFVPSYQRGYRWTPKEVSALLDDIEGFIQSHPSRESYYCLQPIVVRHRVDGSWEVVDGQQRLTTISLILGCLADLVQILGKRRYTLRYETREGSAEFVQAPTSDGAAKYIDFHHMYEARKAIEAWFASRDGTFKLDVIKCLTQANETGANVRIIWYELSGEQEPRAVFLRLNVGRIPLTNAELIRALLLRTDDGKVGFRQQQIAYEWDIIEKRLQDSAYWYFLQNDDQGPATRIEFLFSVYCRVHKPQLAEHADDLATFLAFQAAFEDLPSSDAYEIWLTFRKEVAQTLEEWSDDRVLYHLVGAIIAVASAGAQASARLLVELLKAREGKTGTQFERELRGRLWWSFMGRPPAGLPGGAKELERKLDDRIEQLRYNDAPGGIRTALLLFNVAGLLDHTTSTDRFRFDAFKQNSWDIEHIRSVAEYIPTSPPRRRSWLEHARNFVASQGDTALLTKIDEQLQAPAPNHDIFQEVFREVRILSGEEDGDDAGEDADALSNLALLDMGTNRSYKNAIFPVKRERIIKCDRGGMYLLPATRKVFLKYYNPYPEQLLRWTAEDQAVYDNEQRETLLRFFQPIVEGAQK